jgi:glycosyltransferase involved in cell wall biosynthesis
MKVIFLGEKNRADAITWYSGIEGASKLDIEKLEIPATNNRVYRLLKALYFYINITTKTADISLSERATSYGLAALFLRSKLKIVAQQGITDAYPEKGLTGLLKRILQRLVYQKSDILHAWGTIMNPAQLRSGCHPTKILNRQKGLPILEYIFKEDDMDRLWKKPYLKMIVTRSLNPEYNHGSLIEAMKILVFEKGLDSMHLSVVGDGSMKKELLERTASLELEPYITFLGRIPYSDIPRVLSEHNVYVSVPLTEGFSASLQEAFATGLFPIVSDIPGNRAVINPNQNGFLVNPLDPKDIAEKLCRLCDLTWRERAILQNRKRIEIYGNKDVNMSFFWDMYLSKYKTKCAE